jgi:hypothetical protein
MESLETTNILKTYPILKVKHYTPLSKLVFPSGTSDDLIVYLSNKLSKGWNHVAAGSYVPLYDGLLTDLKNCSPNLFPFRLAAFPPVGKLSFETINTTISVNISYFKSNIRSAKTPEEWLSFIAPIMRHQLLNERCWHDESIFRFFTLNAFIHENKSDGTYGEYLKQNMPTLLDRFYNWDWNWGVHTLKLITASHGDGILRWNAVVEKQHKNKILSLRQIEVEHLIFYSYRYFTSSRDFGRVWSYAMQELKHPKRRIESIELNKQCNKLLKHYIYDSIESKLPYGLSSFLDRIRLTLINGIKGQNYQLHEIFKFCWRHRNSIQLRTFLTLIVALSHPRLMFNRAGTSKALEIIWQGLCGKSSKAFSFLTLIEDTVMENVDELPTFSDWENWLHNGQPIDSSIPASLVLTLVQQKERKHFRSRAFQEQVRFKVNRLVERASVSNSLISS